MAGWGSAGAARGLDRPFEKLSGHAPPRGNKLVRVCR